jgi:uncharacterized membrane protein YbhN (UPF0104 family)
VKISPRVQLALRIVAAAIVVAACVYFVRHLDLPAFGRALADASLPLVVAAAAINFFHIGLRSLRFRQLLAPVAKIRFWSIYHYCLASAAASNLLPARAGEALRVWLLKSRHGVSATTSVAAALLEKGFDLVALLALAAPLPLLLPSLPPSVSRAVMILAAITLAVAVAVFFISRIGKNSPGSLADRFARGTAVVRRPADLAVAIALSLASWLTDAGEIVLILWAVHANVPPAAALLILLTLNVALAIPSTPAQIGAFEIGAVLALKLLGVDEPRAFAFAIIYHVMQALPVTLAGLSGLRLAAQAKADNAQRSVAG